MARERTKPDEEMGLQKELAFHAPPPALSFPGTRSKPAQQCTTLRDKPCGKKKKKLFYFMPSSAANSQKASLI